MDLGLKGKAALVTASSKGIGFGIAKVLASEGCNVAICSRGTDSINRAKDQIVRETGNGEVYAFSADLTAKEDVDRLAKNVVKKLGGVDILAYNTGPPKPGTFSDLNEADWDFGAKLLLMNAVWLAKRILPSMERKKWGRLVFITSTTLRQPIPNLVLSNTVRLSLAGLCKSLATEFGGKGITSNGIMQGHILTDRQREIAEDVSRRTRIPVDDAMKQALVDVPLGRYGTPEEVGYLVAFLASDKASYINGAMIPIDGGLIRATL
ncbi:SDR family oxidoreductase [Candidatus Bathyarchaeota archaeon]|nr:MAG: SDR family oxidoreductase [Candidatus Bathyarchaeota archaeon]